MDIYKLQRFVEAQEDNSCGYKTAISEMKSGGKRSHWIWYVFPQIFGLGSSKYSKRYAIRSLGETKAYLLHPVLGLRLREITNVILSYSSEAVPNEFMIQPIDALKLKSCMTLFNVVSPNDIYAEVLCKFFNAEKDRLTLNIVRPLLKKYRQIEHIKQICIEHINEFCSDDIDIL